MVLVTGSWKMWLVGLGVSLGIFLILYFTVIKSSTDTANNAVKAGIQQSQQALNNATKQLNSAGAQAGGQSSPAGQQLTKAAKLTACVSAAGTDITKVQACQAQFGH